MSDDATEKRDFSIKETSEIVGVPWKTLALWLDRHHITCSKPARGQGTRNLFSIEDISRLRLFLTLVKRGYTRPSASLIVYASPNDGMERIGELEAQVEALKARVKAWREEQGRDYEYDCPPPDYVSKNCKPQWNEENCKACWCGWKAQELAKDRAAGVED
jgi:DNA-binding transcriptional MerR regulator